MDAIPPVAAMDAVPPVAAMGQTPDDWEEAIGKPDSGGATAEDAAELAATMTEDAVHVDDGINALDGDAQNAAVVAAAVEAVDAPLSEEAVKALPVLPRRLTRERKERLDALGFIWSLRNKRIDDHWDEMFRLVSWTSTWFLNMRSMSNPQLTVSFHFTVGPIQRSTRGLPGSIPV
jgi:hypothetical protein